ncbi:VIT1/CCC1 transporter family protein [Candidatus Microgenomates bacterium]|nr:VIT1/CCC1 transporter family protein [Candidatus Microgenomates bacterium]
MHLHRKLRTDYVRSLIFGFEDGLVSTTGAVVGISTGIADPKVVILAGVVIITVEAVSMAAGELVTEQTVESMGKPVRSRALLDATVMFFAYFGAGLIPIIPFVMLPVKMAIVVSLVAAFISLFLLGVLAGKLTNRNPFKRGLQILLIGGVATIIGVLVGLLLRV